MHNHQLLKSESITAGRLSTCPSLGRNATARRRFSAQAEEAFFFDGEITPVPGYYSERLAAERLRACYDLAPPRTSAYLEAEIEFVLTETNALHARLCAKHSERDDKPKHIGHSLTSFAGYRARLFV
jgi:hypothetical protein